MHCIIDVTDTILPRIECKPYVVYLENDTHAVDITWDYETLKDSIAVLNDMPLDMIDFEFSPNSTRTPITWQDYPYGDEVVVYSNYYDTFNGIIYPDVFGVCRINVVPAGN